MKNYQTRIINETEIEIKFFGLYASTIRVVLMNRTTQDATYNIALPWGKDFSQAYRWVCNFKVGGGKKAITDMLNGQMVLSVEQNLLISAIQFAVKLLKDNNPTAACYQK